MKCQAPNRRGSLGNALVDKLIGFIAAAAWLWVLSQLIVGLATASAWKLAGAIAVAVAGFVYLAYAAARARTRVRHEAYSSRVKRECDRLIAERDAIVIERDTLARKLSNRDQQAGELTDALERATRDLISSKSRADGLAESLAESAQGLAHYWGKAREEDRFDPTKHQLPSLREALELLDLIDTHTYTGDDGTEWQVTAFRDKRTDAFAYKAPPLIAAPDQQQREEQAQKNRERAQLAESLGSGRDHTTLVDSRFYQGPGNLERAAAIGAKHPHQQAAARAMADFDEVRTLVRLVHAEVAALRTLPAFGNQTEPLARLADLIDQMRRQLHMSGADAEEDATGN